VFAFFLESTFLGLYIFGRNKVSKGVHWFASLMVAVGATISAFWIIVANSWQQTPAGYVVQNGRAELTDFWAAVFNPSTLPRFFHTVDAALISGAFFMAGVSAYLVYKNKGGEIAKKALKVAAIFGLVVTLLEVFPFGHISGQQVAKTQPEKFAAIQGLYTSQDHAAIAIFAFPTTPPPLLKAPIEIPGLLSWLAFGDVNAKIQGINEFPKDDIPPLFLTFVSYHNMVALGMLFILIMVIAVYKLYKNTLWESKKFLKVLMYAIPFPLFACQLGWISAEVGRQPWIVYKLMRTSDAASVTVGAGEIIFSIILFGLIYILLASVLIYLLTKKIKHGPDELTGKEVLS